MPTLRQISATGMPSAPCLRMNAFWASENFEAFIVLRSSQPGNRRRKLYPKRSSLAASEQVCEQVLVEALVTQASVEAFHEAILHRFAGRDVVPFDAVLLLPGPQR